MSIKPIKIGTMKRPSKDFEMGTNTERVELQMEMDLKGIPCSPQKKKFNSMFIVEMGHTKSTK